MNRMYSFYDNSVDGRNPANQGCLDICVYIIYIYIIYHY